MSAIAPQVPAAFERIIRKCLAKDPEARWQTARDLVDELRWIEGQDTSLGATPGRRAVRRAWLAAAVVALAVTLVNVAFVFPALRSAPTEERAVRFAVAPPDGSTFGDASGFIAVSPDGRSLAFGAMSQTGDRALWVRSLDSTAVRQIAGTEGGLQPFWSPDSRFLGFAPSTVKPQSRLVPSESLKKIDLAGGPATTLVEAPGAYTGTWNRDGVVVFMVWPSPRGGLYQVSASGGTAAPVTTLDQTRGEHAHLWPQFLPDGRHFLYTALSKQPEHDRVVYVGSLDGGDPVRLVSAHSRAEYAPPGVLLYVRGSLPASNLLIGGTLVAQPFDAASRSVTGEPIRIAGDVDLSRHLGRGAFSVSETGVLAYCPVARAQLGWYDRDGALLQSIGAGTNPSLSPDGRRLAVARLDPDTGTSSIWLMDPAGGSATRFTTGSSNDDSPFWSRDGTRIIFEADRDQGRGLYQRAADGTGSEETLLPAGPADPFLQPLGWSGDGSVLVFMRSSATTGSELAMLPPDGDRRPVPLLPDEPSTSEASTSSDGRWIAYVSAESGGNEVYVRPFPSGAGKWKVSVDGGTEPVWRGDGQEIFYLAPDRTLMAVAVRTSSTTFEARAPVRLFKTRTSPPTVGLSHYVASADGQRFLINQLPEGRPAMPITVVLNWTAALKKESR